MIDMVKIGQYQSYMLDRKSSEMSVSCFALTCGGVGMVMIEGKKVTGTDDDKHRIIDYINSVAVKKVRDVIVGAGDIDKQLMLLVYFDFEAWGRFNHRLGKVQLAVTEWDRLTVRLIIDAERKRNVQLALVMDDSVVKLSVDLRDKEVTGDLLHRQLVPVYYNNPDLSHKDAVLEACKVGNPDPVIVSQADQEYRRLHARSAHLN